MPVMNNINNIINLITYTKYYVEKSPNIKMTIRKQYI